MSDFVAGIARIRDSVAAVMKISSTAPAGDDPSSGIRTFEVTFVGTAWCIAADRYFVTAHHIFSNGRPRDPSDRFVLFFVPGNGLVAHHTPVVDFPLEDAASDIAIIAIEAPPRGIERVPSLPVSFDHPDDGARVLTYGFPSPVITAAVVDVEGNWGGGQVLLKSHANEGIVAGQYDQDATHVFELNVGWHHGESGGPIVCASPLATFAVMQGYRGIQSPNGVYAGPHQGRSLGAIRSTLDALGVSMIEA